MCWVLFCILNDAASCCEWVERVTMKCQPNKLCDSFWLPKQCCKHYLQWLTKLVKSFQGGVSISAKNIKSDTCILKKRALFFTNRFPLHKPTTWKNYWFDRLSYLINILNNFGICSFIREI